MSDDVKDCIVLAVSLSLTLLACVGSTVQAGGLASVDHVFTRTVRTSKVQI